MELWIEIGQSGAELTWKNSEDLDSVQQHEISTADCRLRFTPQSLFYATCSCRKANPSH